jgi:hypothetical protein
MEGDDMKFLLGADIGKRRMLHLEGCPYAKYRYRMLDGLVSDSQIISALGASLTWTSGCSHCMPKLSRKIDEARHYPHAA